MKQSVPIIFGIQGFELSQEERDFFAQYIPIGFILFRRNIRSTTQVRRLVQNLKEIAAYPVVCIDEEGGTVSRLEALGDNYRLPEVSQLRPSWMTALRLSQRIIITLVRGYKI